MFALHSVNIIFGREQREEQKKQSRGLLFTSGFFQVATVIRLSVYYFQPWVKEETESRFVCVWLDNQLMISEDHADAQDQLRTLVKVFRTFRNLDNCVEFHHRYFRSESILHYIKYIGQTLIPLIHSFEQIASIYLFSSTKSTDEEWTKEYKKIKRNIHDVTLIPNRFQLDTTDKKMIKLAFQSFLQQIFIPLI